MIAIDIPLWAARLRAWRRGRLWSREELGRRLAAEADEDTRDRLPAGRGLTETVRSWETGERRPGERHAELLCRLYGAGEADLFGESGEPAGTALWHHLTGVPLVPGRFTPEEEERTGRAIENPARADLQTVAYLEALLDACARSSRRPADLADVLSPVFTLIEGFHGDARPSVRRALIMLSSEDAETISRMRYEAGDLGEALRWSDRARRAAGQSEDERLVAYTLAGRAGLTGPRSDPGEVVEIAVAARERPIREHAAPSPRLAALTRLREARGHAMAGEEDMCHRRLEESAEPPEAEPEERTRYTFGYSPSLHEVLAAECFLDLGHLDDAIEILERELASAQTSAATAYDLARLAHAYADAHESERCAQVARRAGLPRQIERVAILDIIGDHPLVTATKSM
ncbi:helix-turn-helix transcriptional regulator, partial [Sphaerisporangium sp. NPDC049002]|uniref:helix-turn-helix transcriptional regulator n=1 Tax=Sphaerisporangium sp. NPDC049002 TaxID=3155392 RepID=UPI0033FE6BDD